MTGEQFADYVARFKDTELTFAKRIIDGGNVVGIEEMPWEAVLIFILKDHGWTVIDTKGQKETPVIPITRHLKALP